ncbi:DUF1304 domain-containing protein [Periweissella beninensis]|uniref:DUF1304 domain-containing protein n=1 Tax=Periweissella beninensis TaxID=504936 RepID=A0ABT0VM91_9LACO|nr:DUF1304 domain-containing protein [Periweissella beninensis]MBM7543909.1 putative membrane protein [Periweissella beninensis]MCM2437635.1 DUF1304 domain-containing protein [Periweissella beninensis]MCT4396171.1 DUF1304 domain-containing protein [Periweissella beninensis]
MSLISTILVTIVALEALGIMFLEMFGSPTKLAQAFSMPLTYTQLPNAQIAMKNQGLYNGFIGIGLLINRFIFPTNIHYYGSLLFVIFVVIAAVYGALSAKNPKIILMQGTPAILALLALLLFK